MTPLKDQFVCDEQGNRIAVLMDLKRYYELLDAAEDLEAVQAFDSAKASQDETVSFEAAIREIEASRA